MRLVPWLLALAALVVVQHDALAKPRAAKSQVATKKKANLKAQRLRADPVRPSFGQAYGLRGTDDPLHLKSSVALVLDQDTNEVLFSKNPQAVLPIASITKLMTALVVTEVQQPLDEVLTIKRSLIVVTHDPTALERMDEILILERGTIAARGPHADLAVGDNLYRRMLAARRQEGILARLQRPREPYRAESA